MTRKNSNNWPYWLPKPRESIEIAPDEYNYLICIPQLKNKIAVYRNASNPDCYYWLGFESELKQLTKYF